MKETTFSLPKTRAELQTRSKEALKSLKDLIKSDTRPMETNTLRPGNIVFFTYDAKDKTARYDRTPLVFIMKISKGYMLGVNFHWAPHGLRTLLLNFILKMNKERIKKNLPLELDYKVLKPFIVKLGYAPILRLYIRKRISKRGVVIPREKWATAVDLRSEVFTGGVSAEQMYKSLKQKRTQNKKTLKKKTL